MVNQQWNLKRKKQNLKRKENNMPFSKYSPKQKKLAKVAKPRNKITAADFKKLQKKKKRNK